MRLFKPEFRDRKTGEMRPTTKWYCDFRDHTQVRRRIPCERCVTPEQAKRFGQMIESLVVAKLYGQQPGMDLSAWLHGLPKSSLRKLSQIGLVSGEAAAANVPLTKHLADFEAWLRTTRARHGFARSPAYVHIVLSQVRHIVKECGATFWGDLTKAGIENALGKLDVGTKSFNHYLASVRLFGKWMIDNGRGANSPAEKIGRVRVIPQSERRGLSFEEMCKLLTTTAKEPPRYGMSGLDRAVCYLLAAETGLRVNEIANLTVGSFDFENATVTQRAEICKNRTEAVQFLKRKRAEQLRAYFDGRAPGDKAFNLPPSSKTADMIRDDLAAGGIEAVNTSGSRPVKVVFHSLRHTLGTALDRSGATEKERHIIGRWSDKGDLSLGTYGHLTLHDLRAAVERLPDYPWPGDESGLQAVKVA